MTNALTEYAELLKALEEAEAIQDQLSLCSGSGNLNAEIALVEDRIRQINQELKDREPAVDSLLEQIRGINWSAAIFASLRYKCGYTWSQAAELTGAVSAEAIKMSVYRALHALEPEK